TRLLVGQAQSYGTYEVDISPGNTKRPASSTGFGTLAPTVAVSLVAVPQLVIPAAQGESVLSRTRMPANAQEILVLEHWLSESVSFIDDVVSRMISTLYGPLYPPFALAVAVDEIVHVVKPSTLANSGCTVAVSVTVMAFALDGEAVQMIPVLVRHFTEAVSVTLVRLE